VVKRAFKSTHPQFPHPGRMEFESEFCADQLTAFEN
jgi:hypothetical protein